MLDLWYSLIDLFPGDWTRFLFMKQALLAASVAMLVACSPAPTPAPPAAKPAPVAVPAAETPAPVETETAAPVVESWELPGDLGPLTTQAQLEARFGKANLREETFDGAEGIGTYPVLVAYTLRKRSMASAAFWLSSEMGPPAKAAGSWRRVASSS